MNGLENQARLQSSTGDRRPWVAVSFFIVATLLAACRISAHDVWLGTPADVEPGGLVKVRLFQGHGGASEPLGRNDRRLQRLYAIDPSSSESDLPGLDGGDPAGVLRPGAEGPWTIVYLSHTAPHLTAADVFNRHLELEGLDHVLEERRRSGLGDTRGRELYSRTLKALLAVGPGPVVDKTRNLDFELVLESAGSDQVVIRALDQGHPRGDVLVDLHPLRPELDAVVHSSRTDAEGRVEFAVPSGGADVWVATAVSAEPIGEDSRSAGGEGFRWRTYFTALTFPRP